MRGHFATFGRTQCTKRTQCNVFLMFWADTLHRWTQCNETSSFWADILQRSILLDILQRKKCILGGHFATADTMQQSDIVLGGHNATMDIMQRVDTMQRHKPCFLGYVRTEIVEELQSKRSS